MSDVDFIRIAGIVNNSIVDGSGIRYTVFVQGCPHNCKGCHNPQTHGFDDGYVIPIKEIEDEIQKDHLLSGITLSGGEPFCKIRECTRLARFAHSIGLNVWVYSGYEYEQIISDPIKKCLLENCDVLVDGEFILDQRDITLNYRGSRNQRVIDIQRSLKAKKIILYEEKSNARAKNKSQVLSAK